VAVAARLFPAMFLTSSNQTKNKVEFNNSNGVIGDVMSHAMAVLHGVIAKDGGLVCEVVYHLHYSTETGPSQLQLFRYIASENICNEHPRGITPASP
jgi:hypothetical protein